MQNNIQLVKITDVKVDEEIYPRNQSDWLTAFQYSRSMQAGAIFPPIMVGRYAGQLYLIDGKHRMEANQKNKVDHIQAIVQDFKSKADMFAKAVELNVVHGKALSIQEKARAIMKLRTMNFSKEQISKIVSIPIDNLQAFVADRMVNTITGEQIIVKAPLNHLAGETVTQEVIEGQNCFGTRSQDQVLDELISLLENKGINLKNKTVLNKLKIIQKLIRQAVLSTRKG
ncbi:MAG: ParB N-terminal domain-containing protein [Magnetococcus sp. YQC-3]